MTRDDVVKAYTRWILDTDLSPIYRENIEALGVDLETFIPQVLNQIGKITYPSPGEHDGTLFETIKRLVAQIPSRTKRALGSDDTTIAQILNFIYLSYNRYSKINRHAHLLWHTA